MSPSLQVDLGGGFTLRSPVLVAAGCFAASVAPLVDLEALGAVVTGSVTPRPVRGAPGPRIAETASGILSANGLQNPGLDAFLSEELPALVALGVPVVASLGGALTDDFFRSAVLLEDARAPVVAVEVNLACPNRDRRGELFGADPTKAAEVAGGVARLAKRPVFAKLSAEGADVVEVARACVRAGVHGLTLISPVPGTAIDASEGRFALAAGEGWLSGPAIRPLAVRSVYRVAQALPETPILGVGGVGSGRDAIEMLLAGAWAVQVGSAMFADPGVPGEVARGIASHLEEHGLQGPADLRGAVRPAAYARREEQELEL